MRERCGVDAALINGIWGPSVGGLLAASAEASAGFHRLMVLKRTITT
jgi:hypothetical protein